MQSETGCGGREVACDERHCFSARLPGRAVKQVEGMALAASYASGLACHQLIIQTEST